MNNKKKIIGFSVILTCILCLCLPMVVSCADGAPPVEKDTIFNLLFPNIWVFGAVILASVILIVTIVWMVWVPFNKKMDEKRDYINKEREEAEQAKLEAIKNKNQAEDNLIQAQSEVNHMITNASIKASAVQDEIIHKAEQEATIIIQNARNNMELERQEMKNSMNEEIMDIAFEAITEISKQKVTKEDNNKLVKEFLENFDKVNKDDK